MPDHQSERLEQIIRTIRATRDYYRQYSTFFEAESVAVEEAANIVESGAVDRTARDQVQGLIERCASQEIDGSMWPFFLTVVRAWVKEAERLDAAP